MYTAYLWRPEVRKFRAVRPASEARGWCASAAVSRRGKKGLRKILPDVPFNEATRPLPDLLERDPEYGMYGAEALSQASPPTDRA